MSEKKRRRNHSRDEIEDVFTEIDFMDDEEEFFEEPEESEKKRTGRKQQRTRGRRRKQPGSAKKAWMIAGACAAALVVVYMGISVYFMSHFYINTEINGQNFSGKSAAAVEKYIKEQVKDYQLKILEKDNKTDTISGSDISMEYKQNSEIRDALKKQNAFLWPSAFFRSNSTKVTIDVAYDEEALNSMIAGLQAVTAEQVPAESAKPEYDGSKYVIKEETYGTAVDMEKLSEKIHQYISEFKTELDMEEEKCYAEPKYTSDSQEVKTAADTMNKYVNASITYTMKEDVVVDKTLISTWLSVDDDMNVTLNQEAMKAWFTEFGDKYDTTGVTRNFTTPTGKAATVSGGDYGWSIDEDTELVNLTNSIQNGEVVSREPAYYQTAASHDAIDWGNTYIEVDLTEQHMWYIKDGAIALETDVVTGVPTPDRITPEGVYDILEMTEDETLIGEDDPVTGEPIYETPVDYWMRVTWTGIGFHDATWQPAFGGTLYKDGKGSHGCINMPLDQASALYGMISVGTPVIVHY